MSGEQFYGYFPPVAVHHVGLVNLDFEEKARSRGVGGGAAMRFTVRGLDNLRTHYESLDRLPVPRARTPHFLRKRFHLQDCLHDDGLGFDETPFGGKCVNSGGG